MNDQPTGTRPGSGARARRTGATVTVHQAHRPETGRAAARTGRFPSSWSRERMAWAVRLRSPSARAGA
ncbi:DUF4291 family protein [Streptomyces sp.]|uniref:DUF4291 family protein n=1 Tax=Streptomyces sp. TaxID=1931 RepID=UPI0035C739EB